MLEIRNRKTLRSKINVCKSDVKIGDCADSLTAYDPPAIFNQQTVNQQQSSSMRI